MTTIRPKSRPLRTLGLLFSFLAAMTLAPAAAQAPAATGPPALESDDEKVFYALGLALSRQLAPFRLSEQDLQRVVAGLGDGGMGRDPAVDLETWAPKIDAVMRQRLAVATEKNKAEGEAFRGEMAARPGATKADSGLIYIDEKPGSGPNPAATDTVKLHYHGTLPGGKVFDSSVEAGEPATFRLDQVVPCFQEGVSGMKVGGKRKLVCPPDMAYGDQGRPPMIPPGSTLVFEIELLDIVEQAENAPPEGSTEPPPDAPSPVP